MALGGRELVRSGLAVSTALALMLAAEWPAAAQQFSCFPEKTCPQMNSCTEAVFHLRECGYSKRDADNDGIPCEAICGKTRKQMNDRLAAGL